ncbi:ATP-binding protein [Paracoccus ravus]|uniref:ATP-binding protein n=1 Tax=Paracoccus ravus TaxID=2447760 RepID=UPI001FD6678E|nr:ATP-binding protein [Paracoccus ravus]
MMIWAGFAGCSALLMLFAVRKLAPLPEIWGDWLALRRLGKRPELQLGVTLVAGRTGEILMQSAASRDLLGDLRGKSIERILGVAHADPAVIRQEICRALARLGQARVDLGDYGRFQILRAGRAPLQLWQAEPAPDVVPVVLEPVDAIDALPVAIVTLDRRAAIIYANDAARSLLGPVRAEQSLTLFLDGLGRDLRDWVEDISEGRMAGGSEVLHLKGGETDRFVQVNLTRIAGGRVTAILSDASALKTLEAQFVQSQKMQAIGQLAGGIAHDFNNLLTAISGHCDLLMLRRDKADPDFSDLDQISQNANRAAALVRQLLAFSRKQTLKPQIMDLRDTLSELTHLLNRLVGEHITLTFDHDPSLRMVRADKRQFEQVIMNLVVNARDAMPAGGDVVVTTANFNSSQPSQVGRVTLPAGEYVMVRVKDHGCGIAEHDRSKIFEPFFTTKRTGEGTGLGLSTAYGIVKQTGGYIFCDSVLGEGTTFSLYFPAHDRVSQSLGDEPEKASAALRPDAEATVLLVEDEAPVRAFASRALKLQGFNVIEACCAEDALELLADDRLHVDVFVTDVIMPGMDGPAWVRTALRNRPDARVIYMSGYTEDVFSESFGAQPDAAFLAKPFSLSDLTALVARQLEMPPWSAGQPSASELRNAPG